MRTAGAPDHIRLVTDHTRLAADGEDLAYVTAHVENARGNLCPTASLQPHFAVSRAGRFRAIGNATCLETLQLPQMPAFRGQLVAIVQAGEAPGAVRVTATTAGLKEETLQLTTTE